MHHAVFIPQRPGDGAVAMSNLDTVILHGIHESQTNGFEQQSFGGLGLQEVSSCARPGNLLQLGLQHTQHLGKAGAAACAGCSQLAARHTMVAYSRTPGSYVISRPFCSFFTMELSKSTAILTHLIKRL